MSELTVIESPCISADESLVDAICARVVPVGASDDTVELIRILAVAAADRTPGAGTREATVVACVAAVQDVAAEIVRGLVDAKKKRLEVSHG